MQMYPRLFPRHRLNDPFRQAERRIFQALEACGAPGFACYEWQRNKQSLQLDFALWVPGVGRFGLQVKGGYYNLSEGEWYRRRGRKGPHVRVNACPLAVTSDATMSLLNEVSETLLQPNYFVPVLLFLDMDPNAGHQRQGPAEQRPPGLAARTGCCPASSRSPGRPTCTTHRTRRTYGARWRSSPTARSGIRSPSPPPTPRAPVQGRWLRSPFQGCSSAAPEGAGPRRGVGPADHARQGGSGHVGEEN